MTHTTRLFRQYNKNADKQIFFILCRKYVLKIWNLWHISKTFLRNSSMSHICI